MKLTMRRLPDARWLPRARWARIVLAVLTPLVVVGVVFGSVQWANALPSDAAFRAGGVVVTKEQLAQRIKMLGALYGIQQPADPSQQGQFRRDAAKTIAVTSVIDQVARNRGIDASDEAVQQVLDRLIAGLNPPGQDSFIRLLSDTGASRNDVVEEIKRQVRSTQLIRQVVDPRVRELSEADFRSYFEQHTADLATPEVRHLRNITVRTRDEADQVADRARSGSDFAALVQENSLDSATRDLQGDLGSVTRKQLEPGYGQAAFSAPLGAVFGPVQSGSGWNVGRVEEIRPSVPRTYEQARDEVVGIVRDTRVAETWNAWLSTQVQEADVRYADEYRPSDQTSQPAALPGQPVLGSAAASSDRPELPR